MNVNSCEDTERIHSKANRSKGQNLSQGLPLHRHLIIALSLLSFTI